MSDRSRSRSREGAGREDGNGHHGGGGDHQGGGGGASNEDAKLFVGNLSFDVSVD
jgi:hypothetical protein